LFRHIKQLNVRRAPSLQGSSGSGPTRHHFTYSLALIAILAALPAAGAASTGSTSDAGNAVANPSFESGITEWSGYRSTLARLAGGTDGDWSATVTAKDAGTWYVYPTRHSVSSAVAGTGYRATATVRVPSGSRTACLGIREWAGSVIVAASEQCLEASSSWKTFPAVTYTVRGSGGSIEVYAYSTKGKKGNAFDVDAFALTVAPTTTSPPPLPDSLAVSLTPPSETAVAGTVAVAASVTSGTAARVEFLADGQLIASDTTAPYSATWDTTTVPDGSVSLTGRAVGSSGETAMSAAQSVNVDNTAPDTTITSGPSGTVATNAASFSFAAGGAATYQCSLNGSAWTACVSPTDYQGLSNATHAFNVRAADALGNVDQTPAVGTWTVNVATPSPVPSPVTCDRVAATNGSDSNAGTLSAPYLTPQKLADTLAAGQTGCLRGGSYSTTPYVLNVSRSGFRIRSYPAERARLIGIVMIRNTANGVTLTQLDFEGTGTMNTIKVHSADVVIEDNTITNLGRGLSCLMLGDNDGWGAAVRTIVRRNRFHDCGSAANGNKDHGIYTGNLVDGQILNNVFWNTAAYAIHLYPNAQRTRVAYNVIDGGLPSVRGGIIVAGDSAYASRDNVVELNVIAYSQTANIETWWGGSLGTGNVARKNCIWAGKQANITGNGLTAIENLVADPLFVDRANRDYRLSLASSCRALIGIDPAAALN